MGTREDVWKEEPLSTETVLGIALTPVLSGRNPSGQNTSRRLDAPGVPLESAAAGCVPDSEV